MSGPFIIDGVDIDLLYAAAGKIDSVFTALESGSPSGEHIKAAEFLMRRDIYTVYCNLHALAAAELRFRVARDGRLLVDSVSSGFDEIAREAAEIVFESRGENGFLEAVNLIMRFFSRGVPPSKEDLFFHMKSVASTNLTQQLKRVRSSDNKLLCYVYSAVTKHVGASGKYSRRGDAVRPSGPDDRSGPHDHGEGGGVTSGGDRKAAGRLQETGPAASGGRGREATVDEIVSLCSADLYAGLHPWQIVDIIFIRLASDPRLAPSLDIHVLRRAVYNLIESRFTPGRSDVTTRNPMQDYLEKELLGLGEEALAETMASYGWREGGSAQFRELFEKSARDLFSEAIIDGILSPFSEVLGRYQVDYTLEKFETTHKGSFQNFWKVLITNFLKKFRAES